MTDPKKRIRYTARTTGLQLDLAVAPEMILMDTYKRAAALLKEQWEERGYLPLEDIEVEITVSTVVQPKERAASDQEPTP